MIDEMDVLMFCCFAVLVFFSSLLPSFFGFGLYSRGSFFRFVLQWRTPIKGLDATAAAVGSCWTFWYSALEKSENPPT